MNEIDFKHFPVLLNETIDGLNIKKDGNYIDGTSGGGGHSSAIQKRLNKDGRLFCFDKDPDAIAVLKDRFKENDNVTVIHSDFSQAKEELLEKGVMIDGALLDLGVSSHQLDTAKRGFSHRFDGELDMRMSQSGISAEEIVNTATFERLCEIIGGYGEEKFAGSIARKIIAVREQKAIETTTQLSDIVLSSVPPSYRRKSKHPAKKTFMGLRIAVNDEYNVLKKGLEEIFDIMNPKARFCVISFHSSEDRIVKQFFNSLLISCTCPKEYPVCICNGKAKAKLITKKPLVASSEELEQNNRSHSAKLRVVEKL